MLLHGLTGGLSTKHIAHLPGIEPHTTAKDSYHDLNGSLDGPFYLSHPHRTYRPRKRTTDQKGLIKGGDLFTLSHRSLVKATFPFA